MHAQLDIGYPNSRRFRKTLLFSALNHPILFYFPWNRLFEAQRYAAFFKALTTLVMLSKVGLPSGESIRNGVRREMPGHRRSVPIPD
jgi:hypothetical protein